MTPPDLIAELKAKLSIDDANVRLNDTGGWYWVTISRELHGQRYRHTAMVALDASDEQIQSTADMLNQWWEETKASHE